MNIGVDKGNRGVEMREIMKVLMLCLVLGVSCLSPTLSYAWRGDHGHGHGYGRGHDNFRFSIGVGIPSVYYYENYYRPDYTYVSVPDYQPVIVNGVTYYLNNGNYYAYTVYGYQLVAAPVTVIQSAPVIVPSPTQVTSINIAADDNMSVNIPSDNGGYTAVVIKRTANGFIGPQSEFYSEFPKVSQLKAMYAK